VRRKHSASELLLERGVIAQAIRIPSGDKFGLSVVFNDLIPKGQMDAELLAAHSFLVGHERATINLLTVQKTIYWMLGKPCILKQLQVHGKISILFGMLRRITTLGMIRLGTRQKTKKKCQKKVPN
jgi:hypothetical protein